MLKLQTHEPVVVDGKVSSMKVNPYMRICSGEGPPVFIQKGKLYGEGGKEIKEVPSWVEDHLKKVDKKALRLVGM